MYHGVLGRDEDLLARQLKFLERNFLIVSLDQAVKELAGGKAGRGNYVVLTFDDGLRNNATVAYPILKRLGIAATFFVCPGLIDSGRWLWTHEARCRLESLDEDLQMTLAQQLTGSPKAVEDLIDWMKMLGLKERHAAEEKIREATHGFQPTTADREAFDVMDWNDLGSLDAELITIGSHTVTHPILPVLTDEQIDFEVKESRRQLEEKVGRAVKYFCYPNGSYHVQSSQAVRRTYEAAVTTESGMVTEENAGDLHNLPRIAATKDGALMAWRLHRPGA